MDYLKYTSHHFTRENELNKLTSLPMCGFIAQLVEHRTGISRRSRVRIPLKPWKTRENENNKLTSLPMCGFIAQLVEHHTGISRRSRVRIPLKPWKTRENELNKLTSLPMCGFVAQLVEHRTGISRRTRVRIPLKPWFFRLLLSNCLNWKIYCDDHSSLSSTTAVQMYELSHIYFASI